MILFFNNLQLVRLRNVDKANYYYILINIGLSAFSFLRSFIFMRVLDMRELGIISLIQTIFMFIGLLQCGLLNGGYRIVSLGKKLELEKTTNSIFSYVYVLFPVGLAFCFMSSYFNWTPDLNIWLLLISVIFGVFTLLNNWMHNCLIGEQKLTELNFLNLLSYGIAIVSLPIAYVCGFWGAIIVLVSQPLIFVVFALSRNNELLPTNFYLKRDYLAYILSFGFIPFLSGIFPSIYLQIERWSITSVLGVESLGCFYLVFLYVSLFNLIPSSINSIIFPKAVKAYSVFDYSGFKKLIGCYCICLFVYSLVIVFLTYFLLEPIVSLIFPKHLIGVGFVFIIVPGLVFQLFSDPITLILNSAVILRPMLYVGVATLTLSVALIFLLINMDFFSLQNVSIVRCLSGVMTLCSYILVFFLIRNNIFKMKEV